MSREHEILQKLISKNETLAVAESCSGGLLGHRLTNVPGSSLYFLGGVIVYANTSKTKLLGVSESLIKHHGAVSCAVAKRMAENIRKMLKSDFGISITGIAGPGGGTKIKPTGLTYIAIANRKETLCQEFHFTGSRLAIKKKATGAALNLFLKLLNSKRLC